MSNDNVIAALLRERASYQSRGLGDRAALVDDALAAAGYRPTVEQTVDRRTEDATAAPSAAEGPVETAVETAPVETAARRRK